MHCAELGEAFIKWNTVRKRQVLRAYVKKIGLRKSGWRWATHERFAPGEVIAGNVRGFRGVRSSIAVMNVEHEGVLWGRPADFSTEVELCKAVFRQAGDGEGAARATRARRARSNRTLPFFGYSYT